MFFPVDIMFTIVVHHRLETKGKSVSVLLFSFQVFPFELQVKSDPRGQEVLLQTEELSPSTSSTPPVSPSSLSEAGRSSTSSPTDDTSDSTEVVKPRRRSGRPRPRPISDYGHLISRKHSIPEEVGELLSEERTANALLHKNGTRNDAFMNGESPESCSMNGDIQAMRQRPVSVIGPVDLFPPDADLKEDSLPSVSCFRFYPLCAIFLKHLLFLLVMDFSV